MGKQSRRKRQHRKKPQPSVVSDDEKSSTLLLRIRHSDPRTRHGALTALSATLLDPEQLLRTKRAVSSELLQAVRERVMDSDLECAQAAAGCLSNFCNFCHQSNKQTIVEGWTVLLVGRLQQCRDALLVNAADKNGKNKCKKQWWALTVQALHALCALIETSPESLARLVPVDGVALSPQQQHFVGTLLDLLSAGRNHLDHVAQEAATSVASTEMVATANTEKHTTDQEELQGWIRDVTVYAVRTLHSAFDDNIELLELWLLQNEAVSAEGLRLLQSTSSHPNLPATTRLHSAGCLVMARQLLLAAGGSNQQEKYKQWVDGLQTQVIDTVVPVLQQYLQYSPDHIQQLLNQIVQAQREWESEEADDVMEKEIIKTVNGRKEPARLIARRQKLEKVQKEKESEAMEEVEVEEDKDGEEDGNPPTRKNTREAVERTRKAWHDVLLPLQLALEISANLTSILPMFGGGDGIGETDDDDDDDAMMEEWGPDQEAQLLAESKNNDACSSNESQLAPSDAVLAKALVGKRMPDSLMVLLKSVCTPLVIPPGTDNDKLKDIPPDVKEDLTEIQSKCSGCIGNCIGNLASWRASDPISVWNELRQASETLASEVNSNGMEGVVSAMVVALQGRPTLRTQIQEGDLDFLLMLLANAKKETLQRDASCMLGILCSTEKHPLEINTKVCTALLLALSNSTKSVMVMSEILNALIDIYGDDEGGHTQVFDSLHVLDAFQQSVPVLKKRIKAERLDSPLEEIEQWKETALNASRFIQYKKGQL